MNTGYQHLGSRVLLSISAVECRVDGAVASSTDALDLLTHAAWSSAGPPLDAVYATVYVVGEDPYVSRARSVEQNRVELSADGAERAVERHSGVDQERRGAEWAYLFTLAAFVMLTVLIALIKAVRSGRITLLLILTGPR